MSAQHTPGPWDYVIADNAEIPFVSVTDQNGDAIAYLVEGVGINVEANARLIAEAPGMLAALREMVALTELHIAERSGTPEEENEFLSCAYLINARALLTHIEGVVT